MLDDQFIYLYRRGAGNQVPPCIQNCPEAQRDQNRAKNDSHIGPNLVEFIFFALANNSKICDQPRLGIVYFNTFEYLKRRRGDQRNAKVQKANDEGEESNSCGRRRTKITKKSQYKPPTQK